MPSAKLLIFLAFWLSFSSALANNDTTKSPQDTYSDGSSSWAVPTGCDDCSICPNQCRGGQVQPPPVPQAPPAQVICPPPPPAQGEQVVCCQQNSPPMQNSPPQPYFYNPNNGQNGGNNGGGNGGGNNGGGNNGSPPVMISVEHKIQPSTATWISAAFFIFISTMARV